MARQPEPGGAGFIHVAHLGAVRRELLVEPIDAVRMRRDRAVGHHVAARVGEGHGDGLGVDIQADVFAGLGCG